MEIRSKPSSREYRNNYDSIFRKKRKPEEKQQPAQLPLPLPAQKEKK